VSCIISERKNVHHSILMSLDSHDSVELEAAIYAASLFAAKSKYVCELRENYFYRAILLIMVLRLA
jgi:hypothetical protein